MPTLIETAYSGKVVWLGHVPGGNDSLRANAVRKLSLDFDGDAGARHEGRERSSCSRVTNLYPERGTRIRNVRQLSILSAEEMKRIANDIELDELEPGLLGASVVLSGIPDFSHVPPSSRLQGPSGVTLTVDLENRPCVLPGREIEAEKPGHGKGFKNAAEGRRGVTAWVERPGEIGIGDSLKLFVPDQRPWSPSG